ncbi:MAG TPA: hypothetical protein VL749_02580 [Patescibacteria group bacterium]|nr:hypothetical protein [Patescibacteria group bacterium]
MALQNGFDDADPIESVQILIPAQNGRYARFPNFVEVDINSQRPSIFGAVIGKSNWPVSVFAVATNGQDLRFPFSMLALNPTMCKAIQVSGTGVVTANGNIQSNSNGTSPPSCGGIGLSRTGGGTIDITAPDATCRSAGTIQNQGSGTMTCTQAPNSFALPDPLAGLDPPTKPSLPTPAMQPVGHSLPVSPYCPGSTANPPTETATQNTCDPGTRVMPFRNTDYRGKAWILSPGLYPNGIHATNGVILYLLPGVYWIDGGGFQVDSDSSVISIVDVADANANPALATFSGNDSACRYADPDTIPQTVSCGVLIYNSQDTSVPFASGPISLGGLGGRLLLSYLDVLPTDPYATYNTMSIFQDRNVTDTVTFNGSTADSEVSGIVYVPSAHLQINGSSSTFILDQVIADSFTVNGNGGTVDVRRNVGIDALITAAGLVD